MTRQSMGNEIDYMADEGDGTHRKKKQKANKKNKLLKAQKSGKKPLSSISQILYEGFRAPREYWEAGCLFYGFSDLEWLRMTNNAFPATLRPDKHTHPCYVLESSPLTDVVCPCTSVSKRSRGTPYIPKGTVLLYTKAVCDRNSYILKRFSYPMLPEDEFDTYARFKGFWPPDKLEYV